MPLLCADKKNQAEREPLVMPTGVVRLEFAPGAQPKWVTADESLHVPVPPGPVERLDDSDVIVRGHWDDGRSLPLVARERGEVRLAYAWPAWSAEVLTEAYAIWHRQPLHTRMPVSYRRFPARIRRRIAVRAQGRRRKRPAVFPSPPFDSGFEALRSVVRRFTEDGPAESPYPRICLTHDIESAEGFGFVRRIAEIEKSIGLRSSWNVVARDYAIDYQTLDWLAENGFEIGLHGYCHDNRLIYLSESQMRRRLDGCVPLIERYGIRGFRSPSWFRSPKLMRALRDYVDYDCSALDFDWYCPAGSGGVLTASPFEAFGLIEIPTTLPLEAMLVGAPGAKERRATWRRKIDWIASVGGQAVVMTHPDPAFSGNEDMLGVYGAFLDDLTSRFGGAWSLPRALCEEVRGVA